MSAQLNVSLILQAGSAAAAAVGGDVSLLLGRPSVAGCSPPTVATFTSHKTGTATAGCLKAFAVLGASQPVVHFYEDSSPNPHVVAGFAEAAAAAAQGEPTT